MITQTNPSTFITKFSAHFEKHDLIKSIFLAAPEELQGVDFSDHLNYWKFGIPALMITDTSFFRNPHYHKKSDTLETLDLERMALVIESVYRCLNG